MTLSERRKITTDWLVTFFQNNDHWHAIQYNGRNFVNNCFGVNIGADDTDNNGQRLTLGKFFLEVAQQLFQELEDNTNPPVDIILEELQNYNTDSLGRGIVLYFPTLKWLNK